jgi:hypothetical protein
LECVRWTFFCSFIFGSIALVPKRFIILMWNLEVEFFVRNFREFFGLCLVFYELNSWCFWEFWIPKWPLKCCEIRFHNRGNFRFYILKIKY